MTATENPKLISLFSKVTKRDGRLVDFNFEKLVDSIFKAAETVGGKDRERAAELAKEIIAKLEQECKSSIPTVEEIQNTTEKILIERGHAKTAKAYILHYHRKNEEHNRKTLIMGARSEEGNLSFSPQALKILERRYLLKDEQGLLLETPQQMLLRVARNIARADALYKATEKQVQETEQEFYAALADLRFLPNSPTLMNAGTKTQQLSSCFVLPVDDSMEGIFGTLRDAALIHQRGSGTGFSFSGLRPRGDKVKTHLHVASGPVAFLGVYDSALEVIKQGGIRPGANMAVLRVDHPDIIRFIESKRDKKSLKNFNISVAVTDRFMRAVDEDRDYFIRNPRTDKYVGKLRARDVFAMITQNAWKTGDPGLLFIDEINRKHPAKHLGDIETTNQCGEAPLLSYEGCALGSINLLKFIDEKNRDLLWDELRETVRTAVHFLDNVIDMNSYPKKKIEDQTKKTRKFGLGIMGFADTLCNLQIKYDSEEGLVFADKLLSFIREETYGKSSELAQARGACPAWVGSEHQKANRPMRNITCLSIAPTGTISLLADASAGCEPLFAISYLRTVLGDTDLIYLNKTFERVARERGFYSPELIHKITKAGSIQGFKEIPKEVRDVFVTAQDISPEWHIKMQSTLQKYVDNSISKTINFPWTASIRDVEEAYLLAWKAKCKGITTYRDGSYEDQVINIGEGY
ncbi:adenosylcobalamin-dependent ribonucleoside-diphosphate reductase [Candidatus Woesearchaeota archaeon]|nr:adenosylcobalamin-dependent ribonucleoside-diphosphate reductase [Candidatus Woesearchaeota archaeon]